jgi:TonB family protein
MTRRGWPGKPALAAALALHLALAALALDWARRNEPPAADQRTLPVTLVLAETPPPQAPPEEHAPPPPRPAAPPAPGSEGAAPGAPLPEPPAVARAPALKPAAAPPDAAPSAPATAPSPPPDPAPPTRGRKPLPGAAKPTPPGTVKKAETPGERPKRETHEAATSKAPPSREPRAGVAIYDVVVDASGKIRSITLAHSSGTTSFDASGEAMIRNGMGFEVPPADPWQEQRLFTVSIAFTPEDR